MKPAEVWWSLQLILAKVIASCAVSIIPGGTSEVQSCPTRELALRIGVGALLVAECVLCSVILRPLRQDSGLRSCSFNAIPCESQEGLKA